MNKILGYILALLGVAGVAAWAIPEFKTALPFLQQLNDTTLMTISIILGIIGIFLIMKSSGRGGKLTEVPIFHGKNVVGYRRHKR